jgi:hypothetical protein
MQQCECSSVNAAVCMQQCGWSRVRGAESVTALPGLAASVQQGGVEASRLGGMLQGSSCGPGVLVVAAADQQHHCMSSS